MNIREMLKVKEEFESKIGHTPKELDEMWNYCLKKGHSLICQLNRCGKNWRDLNINCISTLEREYFKLINEVKECH